MNDGATVRVDVGAAEESGERHWEMLTGGQYGRRWLELLHDGGVIAGWMYSANEARWFPSRRPRPDDPAIPADVLGAAEAQMRT